MARQGGWVGPRSLRDNDADLVRWSRFLAATNDIERFAPTSVELARGSRSGRWRISLRDLAACPVSRLRESGRRERLGQLGVAHQRLGHSDLTAISTRPDASDIGV
jgi:hypothetical protein